MGKYTTQIALIEIDHIELYINKDKLPLSKIVSQLHPDIAITGNFYSGAWKPVCPLKSDGTVHCADRQYAYHSLVWNDGPDIHIELLPKGGDNPARNYITNCVGLVNNETQTMYYGSDVGGRRGRTGWGFRDGKLAFIAFPDGADGMTPEQTRDYVKKLGWSDFILGDGGGKVNFYDRKAGAMLQGRAASQNLILVYLKKKEDKPTDIDITKRYMTKNRCYTNQQKRTKNRAMLHSTATPGASAKNILDSWNSPTAIAGVEFVIDDSGIYQGLPLGIKSWHGGGSSNDTYVGVEMCEPEETIFLPINWRPLSQGGKYNKAYAVKRLQQELMALGFDPKGVDGSFGPGCASAVKAYQRSIGISADGSVGPTTLKYLQKREGSYLRYNRALAEDYFSKVYRYAVELFAWLMGEIGGNPEEIICHSEGYKKGIATNHADVLHWFPQHGKTMDIFRADVAAAISGAATPSDPLGDAVDKLVSAGLINSPDYWKGGNYSAANVQALIIKWANTI